LGEDIVISGTKSINDLKEFKVKAESLDLFLWKNVAKIMNWKL